MGFSRFRFRCDEIAQILKKMPLEIRWVEAVELLLEVDPNNAKKA
jgi:hypothetical protein